MLALTTVVTASKPLELVITHSFLESMIHMYSAISSRPSREPSAARMVAMPYIVVNLTGFELSIWPEDDKEARVTKLQHGDSVPWTFQDWRALRQATGRRAESSNKLAIHLFGSQWESVRKVLVDRPGLTVYPLRPRIDGVSHKLACFVELQPDNIKRIYLRSTCLFSNRTSFTIEVLDVDGEAERSLSRNTIQPVPPHSSLTPLDRIQLVPCQFCIPTRACFVFVQVRWDIVGVRSSSDWINWYNMQ